MSESRSMLSATRRTRVSARAAAAGLGLVLFVVAPGAHAALRDLSTDRPDRTESPYTVDPGHVQVEMDALAWTRERERDATADAFGIATTNAKLGLASRADLQLVWECAVHLRETLPGFAGTRRTGIGDLTARLKLNLFGNDGGSVALALMPFVTFPTAHPGFGVGRSEGGLIVPAAFALPRGWQAGAMLETDVVRDDAGRGTHAEFVASLTASHAIAGALSGYGELYSVSFPSSGEPWRGTADAGLTLGLGENLQLDAGANVGLSDTSEDFTVFAGLSFRR